MYMYVYVRIFALLLHFASQRCREATASIRHKHTQSTRYAFVCVSVCVMLSAHIMCNMLFTDAETFTSGSRAPAL